MGLDRAEVPCRCHSPHPCCPEPPGAMQRQYEGVPDSAFGGDEDRVSRLSGVRGLWPSVAEAPSARPSMPTMHDPVRHMASCGPPRWRPVSWPSIIAGAARGQPLAVRWLLDTTRPEDDRERTLLTCSGFWRWGSSPSGRRSRSSCSRRRALGRGVRCAARRPRAADHGFGGSRGVKPATVDPAKNDGPVIQREHAKAAL